VKRFSFWEEFIEMYKGLHVKYPLFLSDFNETGVFSRQFRKIHIKFHKNSSRESRVVPCDRADTHDAASSRFSQFCEHASNDVETSCGSVPLSLSVRFFKCQPTERILFNCEFKPNNTMMLLFYGVEMTPPDHGRPRVPPIIGYPWQL